MFELFIVFFGILSGFAKAVRDTVNDHATKMRLTGSFWDRKMGMDGDAGKWKNDGWHWADAFHVGSIVAYFVFAAVHAYVSFDWKILGNGPAVMYFLGMVFWTILFSALFLSSFNLFYKKLLIKK